MIVKKKYHDVRVSTLVTMGITDILTKNSWFFCRGSVFQNTDMTYKDIKYYKEVKRIKDEGCTI